MKRIPIIFIFLLLIAPLESYPNSLGATARSSLYGGDDPYLLLNKAEAIYKKDVKQALDLISEAVLMALQQNNKPAQGDSYILLGDINAHLKQYDLAAANYQRALSIFKELRNREKVLELFRLSGEAYANAKIYDKALSNYQQFIRESEKPGSSGKKTSGSGLSKKFRSNTGESTKRAENSSLNEVEEVRVAISEIYAKQKEFEKSIQYLDTVAVNIDTVANPEKQIILNDKLGDVYGEQERDDEAVQLYRSNTLAANKLNNFKEEAKANDKIADIYTKNQRNTEALTLRERSIEIYNLSKDTIGLAKQYLEKGKLLNDLGQLTKAETSLQSALQFAESIPAREVEQEALKEMSSLEEKRGRFNRSLSYFKKYIALQDDAFIQKRKELEAELELNASLNQQQLRIDLLEKDQKLSDNTIEILRANETITKESNSKQRLIIYGLLTLVLLLGISGYLMYKNMQRRRVANQLLALKSLRAQMNPHFIFNALNSVNHYISQKDERAANKYLSDFSRLMRAVLEHSQKDFISLEKEFEIIGLYLNLEHNRFSEKFDYVLEKDEDLDIENTSIPPMLVQPYVENAIWHGLRYKKHKGNLKVQYLKAGDGFRIVVEDNGIGRGRSEELKTENQKKNISTGMSNIEDRLKIINRMYGTSIAVKVEDLKDGGTRVILDIPFMDKDYLEA